MPFLAIAFAAAAAPTLLTSHIISASIFKPGLSLIIREVDIPAGSGEYTLDDVPEAVDGSFWYSSPDLIDVSDLRTVIRKVPTTVPFDAKTIGEYIFANVGKRVSFFIAGQQKEWEKVEGLLTDLNENDGSFTLKLDNDSIRQLTIGQILQLDIKGLKDKYEKAAEMPQLRIQFKASAAKAGRVRFTTLEGGGTWNSSYSIGLEADGNAILQGKAQLAIGNKRFKDTDVKLMAGYPNLPTTARYDLATGAGDLNTYLRGGQTLLNRPGAIGDPFLAYQAWLAVALGELTRFGIRGNYPYAYGGGGFSGGFGGSGGGNGGYPMNAPYSERSGQLLPNDAASFRTESLFAYPLGKISLEPGDRLTQLLFQQHSRYRNLFLWDGNQAGADVQSILRIHNEGKTPWTGGLAMVLKEDVPLAQLEMPFTSPGKDADLVLGKPQDIKVSYTVNDTSMTVIPATKKGERSIVRTFYTMVLTAENERNEDIKLEMRAHVNGQLDKTAEARIVKLPRKPNDRLNAMQDLIWEITLPASSQKKIEVTYTRDQFTTNEKT